MHLIRCLVFIEARHNCFIQATYINTRENHLADDLSRNRASHILSKVPTPNHPQYHRHYCTCCWNPMRTGYRGHCARGSAIFRGRTSAGDPEVVHGRHKKFCTRCNIDTLFPMTEHLLCCFAAYLADDGLASQSIKSYLSAVWNLELSLGLPDTREQSTLPLLKRVQAGIARCRVRKGTPRRVRLPITSHILARISERLRATSHPEQVVVQAVAFSAFFGFFRLGELLPVTQAAYNPATSRGAATPGNSSWTQLGGL